jgi:Tfp pilus assembly protein PilF
MIPRGYGLLGSIAACRILAAVAAPRLASQQTDSATSARLQPSRKAKEAFDRAAAQLKGKDTTATLASLKRAVEADPDYLDAHAKFVKLTEDRMIVRDDSNYARTQALAMRRPTS